MQKNAVLNASGATLHAFTAVEESVPRILNISNASDATSNALSKLVYQSLKLERANFKNVSTVFAAFGANWPCIWGEEIMGNHAAVKRWPDGTS
jgi:hypothetical protein